MRKIIAVILSIISLFTYTVYFGVQKSSENNKIQQIEMNIKGSRKILLPNKLTNKSQNEVLNKIIESLDKFKGDIYYSRFDQSEKQYRKYIYLNSKEYLKNLKLDDDEAINKFDMKSNNFLATVQSDDSNQIGKIESFAGLCNLKVATLNTLLDDGYLLDGYCVVNFQDNKNIDAFIEDLSKSLEINKEDIQLVKEENTEMIKSKTNIFIIIGMYFIVMLLILYDTIKSYKEIAIKKMMGISNIRIFLERLSDLLKVQLIGSFISILGISVILFKEYNIYYFKFLFNIFNIWLIQNVIIIVISLLQYIYISKIKINEMLKNRQPVNLVLYSNLVIKIILLTLFVFLINLGLNNYTRIQNLFTNKYQSWDELSEYCSIPNLSDIDMTLINSEEFKKNQKKLYIKLNAKGSILANFEEYIPSTRNIRMQETEYDYERDNVTINPNYLNKYHIYDSEGNIIKIGEDETSYVVLIPDKYKKDEQDIRNMIQLWKEAYLDDDFASEAIKIIWTRTGQRIFSINIDVNPNEDNCVEDPIIRVLTESNGTLSNYDTILGISGNPLKIKVEDEENKEEEIKEILGEFGYDRYVKSISFVNQEVSSEINSVKDLALYLSVSIIFLIIAIVCIIIQSIYTYFQQHKQLIIVRQLNGYKILNKYREYFIYLVISWGAILIVEIASGKIPFKNIYHINLVSIVIELIVTIIILKYSNSKKISSAIKGGI